ncbi:MAG: Hsp20/alpha crystallin family protein [Bdellovibrionales bacterium]|nr:Hsp20/alpha crystallin family protein [Bdellovibrionales bacterium]
MSILTRKTPTPSPTTSDPFSQFQEEMNRLMENFWGRNHWLTLPESSSTLATWAPKVDVSETEKEYKVRAEIPGVDQDHVEVNFQDNTLYLKGERKFQEEEKQENFHRIERSYGRFQRTIPFATRINEEKISAHFDRGILTVSLAKADEVVKGSRKINVSTKQ